MAHHSQFRPNNYRMTSGPLCILLTILSLIRQLDGLHLDVTTSRIKKLLEDYSPLEHPVTSKSESRPDDANAQVTPVQVQLRLSEINLKSLDRAMHIEADWSVLWTDPRLSAVAQDSPTPRDIPRQFTEQIWTPDVYLRNARQIALVNFPVEQRRLTIDKNGVLRHSRRVRAELSCPSFSSHPKSLTCAIYFETYGAQRDEVDLSWKIESGMSIDPGVSVPLYSLIEINAGNCPETKQHPPQTDSGKSAGNTCIVAFLVFKPSINFFGSEIYGVTFLLVAISWVGFWIDGRYVTVRLGIGLSVVLILVIYGIGFRIINLTVGAAGNVELWVAFCIMLVLASVIEFIFVHIFLKSVSKFKRKEIREKIEAGPSSRPIEMEVISKDEHAGKVSRFIDKICGVVFPLVFICFNIIYWIAY